MSLHRRLNSNLSTVVCAGSFLFLSSCGALTPQGSSQSAAVCAVVLLPEESSTTVGSKKSIVYSGQLTADCQQQSRERSGRALVKLTALAAVASDQVGFQELSAGLRTLQFDAQFDNLRRGSYEKNFDSTLLPDWQLPWVDKPTWVKLSMNYTESVPAAALPKTVGVELIF
ncbi:hypothetical protein EBU99_01985 [bacterium]|nr:hypothetical protein [bacterium]